MRPIHTLLFKGEDMHYLLLYNKSPSKYSGLKQQTITYTLSQFCGEEFDSDSVGGVPRGPV